MFDPFLEWRFHSALFLACDGRLLQIKLALDASARLVGNFALSQQPVDEFTLGGDQVRPEVPDSGSNFKPVRRTSRQPSHTIVMPRTQNCQDLGCNSALGRKSVEAVLRHVQGFGARGKLSCMLALPLLGRGAPQPKPAH